MGAAVASPVRVTSDETTCRALLSLLPGVPAPVWGRDELDTGEMWNSNSVISWALTRCGVPAASVPLPAGGTAPGWAAGSVIATRQLAQDAAAPPFAARR